MALEICRLIFTHKIYDKGKKVAHTVISRSKDDYERILERGASIIQAERFAAATELLEKEAARRAAEIEAENAAKAAISSI